ncbi:MAG: MarR family winged helix-turn-helix transcriptional regulator [Actinomycetota bacterium]|nr:MarR family winged helix-turn-helix transcriptional regulator [Actinomycetota bacterium]
MADADRSALEAQIADDVRALTAESDQIGHHFAGRHSLTANDFRALLHVLVAETAGTALTAGELRNRMGTSGAAITYLVERMIVSDHLVRDTDPADRRKVKLRVAEHGRQVARDFFTPLAQHTGSALADLPDEDLTAAHRVFVALVAAMRAFRADLDAGVPPG